MLVSVIVRRAALFVTPLELFGPSAVVCAPMAIDVCRRPRQGAFAVSCEQ